MYPSTPQIFRETSRHNSPPRTVPALPTLIPKVSVQSERSEDWKKSFSKLHTSTSPRAFYFRALVSDAHMRSIAQIAAPELPIRKFFFSKILTKKTNETSSATRHCFSAKGPYVHQGQFTDPCSGKRGWVCKTNMFFNRNINPFAVSVFVSFSRVTSTTEQNTERKRIDISVEKIILSSRPSHVFPSMGPWTNTGVQNENRLVSFWRKH